MDLHDDDHDRETVEQIPWSALVAEHDDGRRRTMYLAAAVVGAAVLGFVGIRALTAGTEPVSVESVSTTVTAVEPTPPDTGEGGPIEAEPEDAGGEPALWSEADLMAVLPATGDGAVAHRAEWFVTDLFTVDGSADGGSAVRAALPPGAVAVDLPHDATSSAASYVEWARALAVEPVAADEYAVVVAFRAIASPGPGEAYERRPVRAVEVRVGLAEDGSTWVVDLPRPAPLPAADADGTFDVPSAEPPPGVAAAALSDAAAWGDDPEVQAASPDGSGWRVLVTIGDPAGIRWPLIVRVDG